MGGQVALVTGASSGIGEATALRLRAGGYAVYAGARRLDRMAALADQGIATLPLDVTDDDSSRAFVETALGDHGRIDVLVNNAGYGSYGAVEEVPLDEGRRQLEVNVLGVARMCQLVIPSMREVRRGRILNVASIGGHFGEPLGAWYHASKFAVEGFSDSLRVELQPFGVKVIVIEPGSIRTEWGPLSLESAERYSGEGPYAPHVAAMRALYANADRMSAEPEVVAEGIWLAVRARRPRPRYAVPMSAKLIIAAATLVPDHVLDAGIHALNDRLRPSGSGPA